MCAFVCVVMMVLLGRGCKGVHLHSLLINLMPCYYPHCQDLADLIAIYAAIKVTRLWKYRLMQDVTEGLLDLPLTG